MTFDEFFNDIEKQLMDPPSRSDAVMAAAMRGQHIVVPQDAQNYVGSARNRVRAISLREEFLPPPNTTFVAFRMEEGKLDVIRARYRARDPERSIIDLAQSKFRLSLRIQRAHEATPSQAKGAPVRSLFTTPLSRGNATFDLPLQLASQVGQLPVFGGVTPAAWPPIFVQEMKWWIDAHSTGFVTAPISSWGQRVDPEEHRWWTPASTSGSR